MTAKVETRGLRRAILRIPAQKFAESGPERKQIATTTEGKALKAAHSASPVRHRVLLHTKQVRQGSARPQGVAVGKSREPNMSVSARAALL
jgi:hypothetical protein